MNKIAVSVTLAAENLAWLRARTRKARARSLSETLDRLIEAARAAQANTSPSRSVVGLLRVPESDPELAAADDAVAALFAGRRATARAGRPAARRSRTAPHG
jgi:ribosomal protein L17